MNKVKVIFLGPSGTGAKTSLINRIIGNEFNENEKCTLSASFVPKIFME